MPGGVHPCIKYGGYISLLYVFVCGGGVTGSSSMLWIKRHITDPYLDVFHVLFRKTCYKEGP